MRKVALVLLLLTPTVLTAQLASPSAAHRSVSSARSQATINSISLSRGSTSPRRIGAIAGFVAGGVATYAILHTGGSTAPCNRSENQDAIGAGECFGLTAGGALAGAGIGYLIGGLFRDAPPAAGIRTSPLQLLTVPGRGTAAAVTLRF